MPVDDVDLPSQIVGLIVRFVIPYLARMSADHRRMRNECQNKIVTVTNLGKPMQAQVSQVAGRWRAGQAGVTLRRRCSSHHIESSVFVEEAGSVGEVPEGVVWRWWGSPAASGRAPSSGSGGCLRR